MLEQEKAVRAEACPHHHEDDPCAPGSCAAASLPALAFHETLRRFDREAVPGICDTGRYRCPYFSWGEGPPLLLIPGLSDDATSFVFVSALLCHSFRCIAYDLPSGRGDGARLGRYRHADLVQDVFALLDHLGIRRGYVLGCSFGSTVALAALHARPDRLLRGVLQGGFAHRSLARAEILVAHLARYGPGRLALLPFRSALLRQGHHEPFAGRPTAFWEFFLERWGRPPLAAAAHRGLLIHRLDLRPLLGEIHQPVLLVHGDRDPLVGRDCAEVLLHGLPKAACVELANCGHNPLFTHPELLAEVVRQFLTPPPCR